MKLKKFKFKNSFKKQLGRFKTEEEKECCEEVLLFGSFIYWVVFGAFGSLLVWGNNYAAAKIGEVWIPMPLYLLTVLVCYMFIGIIFKLFYEIKKGELK